MSSQMRELQWQTVTLGRAYDVNSRDGGCLPKLLIEKGVIKLTRCTRKVSRYSSSGRKGRSMNSQIVGLRVASIIFGLISLAQLLRLVIQPEVIVAGRQMPLWPSVLAFLIFGG